jgi:hypothetical protein
MLNRTSIADVRRRPVSNQTLAIVSSQGLQLLSGGTFPNVVMAMVFETSNTHLLRPVMGMTC